MNEHPFDTFEFSIPLTDGNELYLKSKGYEKRNGTCAYPENRKIFVVVPFKKWYWEDVGRGRSVHLTIVEEVITKRYLAINRN